jgi:hypothetical protein
MKLITLFLAGTLYMLSACAMFTAWRAIPPPGGCDECHKVPISANWQVSYRPADINSDLHGASFQTPQSVLPPPERPASPEEKQKVEELTCFECHNSPDAVHKGMKGKFHH